ncbi:MAG TPA: hypothetical protein PKC28_15585 [Bdellovibrionales bacterium]|nr:hypothetical protein [Bdellovibrionales bacterium]
MKIFWSAFLLTMFCFAAPSVSFAQLVCRGDLSLSTGDKATIAFSPPTLQEGGSMGLWHPITEDIDAGVQMTIQKLLKAADGVRAFVTYDRTNFTGFVTFEAKKSQTGELVLSDFKGFEGDISFGPSEIKCTQE